MPAFTHLLSEPRSDDFARRLTWTDTVPLGAAPAHHAAAPPQRTTLIHILDMDMADDWFAGVIDVRFATTSKAFYAFLKADRGIFGLKLVLIDADGRLCWKKFVRARAAVAAHPGMRVTEIHAKFSKAAVNIMKPARKKTYRLNEAMKFIHEKVNANKNYLTELGYTFRIQEHYAFDTRFNGKLEGPFPSMRKFFVDNSSTYTGELVTLLRGMPRLTHVGVLGGLEMLSWDDHYPGTARPTVLDSVAVVLPTSLVLLDIDTYQPSVKYARTRFVGEFVAAAEQGRFNNLQTLRMSLTYATMIKAEGVPFVKSLERCTALRTVIVGDEQRFKTWHLQALTDLKVVRPDIQLARD